MFGHAPGMRKFPGQGLNPHHSSSLSHSSNPPTHARGLAVPGMPIGSPGMESGDAFQPYQVMLLKDDGGPEVYATVSTPADQHAADDVP